MSVVIREKSSQCKFLQFRTFDFCFIITDDLNISGIIVAVVFVALVMVLCGLGVFYAQKKGYFASK